MWWVVSSAAILGQVPLLVLMHPDQSDVRSDVSEEFFRFYSCQQSHILAYIRALVPDPSHADDVFQSTNLALWRSFSTFRRDADFRAWALGVARNQVLMFWRAKRQDRHVFVFSESWLAQLADDAIEDIDSVSDLKRSLDACVERLGPRQKDLIRMFYGENQSAETIAASWNRTVHAVYKALKVMRRSLLECVEQSLAAGGLPVPSGPKQR